MGASASPGTNRALKEEDECKKEDHNGQTSSSSSYFLKTISLIEWWLIKAEKDFQGKRLAVAGFTSREQPPLRLFSSAPIAKRHDVWTLETADGVTVILQGFINRTRTIDNGFSSEVLDHFLFGFPPYWELFGEKCLKQVDNSASDLPNSSDLYNPSADSGSKDCTPILTQNNLSGISGPTIRVREDCCHCVPEKFTIDASKCSNLDRGAATLSNSAEEESHIINCSTFVETNNLEGIAEPSKSQTECHLNFSVSLIDNDSGSVKNDTSKNIPPSFSCYIMSDNSIEDHSAIQAEPSSRHTVGKVGVTKKSKKKTAGKTENKESASPESTVNKYDTIKYEENSVPKDSSLDNLNASTFPLILALRNSGEGITVFSNKPTRSNKKQKENQGNKDLLLSATTDFPTASSLQGPNGALRHNDEKEVVNVSTFWTPSIGDTNEQSVNHVKDATIFSAKYPGAEFNANSPSTAVTLTASVVSSRLGCRRSSRLFSNLKNNLKKKHISGCSVKHTDKELKSESTEVIDRGKLKRSSCTTPLSLHKVDIPQAMMRAASRLMDLEGNLKSKERNDQMSNKKGGSYGKRTRRKINFDANLSPLVEENEEKTCIHSTESLSFKRSRSGRLLIPTLDFWRNQIPVYDGDRNFTGIQEEIVTPKPPRGSKSEPQKKQKRW